MIGKKGFIFTLLVVVLFILILLSARAWLKAGRAVEELNAVGVRAGAMRSAMSSVSSEMERMTSITANASLYYGAFYASRNLTPLSDTTANLSEIAWNGTLGGQEAYGCGGPSDCNFTAQMGNNTLSLWLASLSPSLQKYEMGLSWGESGFSGIGHASHYEVSVENSAWFYLNDSQRTAAYERQVGAGALVNITGFEDPYFPLATGGAWRRNVEPWPHPPGYSLAQVVATGQGGDGWVYGKATTFADCCDSSSCANSSLISPEADLNTTLVVENATALLAECKDVANAFRGVLSNHIDEGALVNITVPYAFNFSGNITQLVPNGTAVLISNLDGAHEALDVERMRAIALGESPAYYRMSNESAPCWISRLRNGSGLAGCNGHGIESLVNYSMVDASMNRSWTDYYFLNMTGCGAVGCFKIKGMPNCEDDAVCADNMLTHFRIDNQSAYGMGRLEYYNMENLSLPNN